jgi:glycosyltransferase involved in cell wall biosynthesis
VTRISAVLITKDEERNLAAALASVAFCDEIVVVDAGSSDRTVEIARAAGARVIVNQPWRGFVDQRNQATTAASHDWVLAVDADERVSATLRAEIEGGRSAGFSRSGFRIPRVARYLGRWVRHTDWYPDWQLRLFDRRHGQWEGGLVHESVRVDGSVGRLRGELEHHPYANIGDHLRKIDRYTDLWARQAYAAGRTTGTLEIAGATAWAFLRNYALRAGFLLGGAGLTISALNAHYTHVKLAKLLELAQAGRRQP